MEREQCVRGKYVPFCEVLDKIVQQAKDRIEHRPAEFSNEDVLKYMTVMSTQLDRTNKIVNEISDKPAIQISQQKTNVQTNPN